MKLSFSSLACPNYNVDQIISCAQRYGFDGVELRTVNSTVNLWELEEFSPECIHKTKKKFEVAGIEVVVVGTSVSFAKGGKDLQKEQLFVLEQFCRMAKGLNCHFLRVFGGPIPQGQTYAESLAHDIEGYRLAIAAAAAYDTELLFETHDDFSTSAALLPLLEGVDNKAGIIWDILHPYRFGEAMETTQKQLMPYVRHVHIKDSFECSSKGFDIALPGEGTVPIGHAVALLKEAKYEGYLCFEWEKHWHPEIADAETALPCFMKYMRDFV